MFQKCHQNATNNEKKHRNRKNKRSAHERNDKKNGSFRGYK